MLYRQLQHITPEYGVDPRVCLLFALAHTGFGYSALQRYSKLSRRLSLTTFDRLYGNNIFMLEGVGTKNAHKVYLVPDDEYKAYPTFNTREDAIRSFCAVVRRCLGDIRDESLDAQIAMVWAYGYENPRIMQIMPHTARFAAQILPDPSLDLTEPDKCVIIGRRVRRNPSHVRLARCKALLAKSNLSGLAPTLDPDSVLYIPSKTRDVLGDKK